VTPSINLGPGWGAIGAQQEPYEKIRAENNTNLFDDHMPTAEKPDF
jgi:hypothetical protein